MPGAPLSGYRVLEPAHLIAGPVCGLYLGDMGADVIKVEAPGAGDLSRTIFRATLGGESSFFIMVNRNKRGVTIDLARPEGARSSAGSSRSAAPTPRSSDSAAPV